MRGANFTQANLDQANFTEATLNGANFAEAVLTKARFAGANLTGANLQGSQLQEADIITASTLARAQYDKFTKFPDGFAAKDRGMVFVP
jgi:uncharacterized protein YjbI with pentapeptide repeats